MSQETSALRIELARALLASGAAFLAQGIITGVLDDPTLDASVTSALELELALASGDPARVTDLLGSLDASKLTSSARADAAELCLMSGDVARAELFAAGARLATDAALAQRVRRLDADILAARDTPLAVVDAAFDLAIAMARAGDLDAALARTALAGALATASRPSPVDSPHVGARPFALATEARDAAKRAADDVLLELASAWRDVFADVTSAADWAAHERARARAAASGHAAHALALELAAAVGRKDATALTSLGERCDREGRGDLATLARRFAAITIR
ncbi:MAG: hypothetical protein U0271_17565 [Polyangiaceae bacterium]